MKPRAWLVGVLVVVLVALVGRSMLRSGRSSGARDGRRETALPHSEPSASRRPGPELAADMPEVEPRGSERAAETRSTADLQAQLELDATPITAIGIALFSAEGGKPAASRQETFERTRWDGLATGRYRVEAAAEGWTPAAAEVELSGTEREAQVRLQLFALQRFAGQVLDLEDGRPVADFSVRVGLGLHSPTGVLESWTERQVELRSPEGRFAFGGVPSRAQLVRLTVDAEGYLEATSEWLAADIAREDLIIRLGRPGLSESHVSAHAVLAETGAAATNALALLVGKGLKLGSVVVFGGEAQVSSAYDVTGELPFGGARAGSDAEGRIRLSTVYEGPARLLVIHDERRPFVSETFELSHGDVTELGTLALAAGATIEGRVVIGAGLQGMVIERVQAQRADGARRVASLDGQGGFRLAGLEPGVYEVAVLATVTPADGSAEGVVPIATRSVALEELETAYVELHCGSGLGGSELRGRIEHVDEITDWRVLVLQGDLSPRSMTLAAEDGTFQLTDVPEGDVTLAVAGRNPTMTRFAVTWTSLRLPEAVGAPLQIDVRSSRIELRTTPDQPFQVSGQTGSELTDRLLAFVLQGSVDADGHAVIWGLPPGSYRFTSAGASASCEVGAEGGSFVLELE